MCIYFFLSHHLHVWILTKILQAIQTISCVCLLKELWKEKSREFVTNKVTCAQESAQEESNGVETRKGIVHLCVINVL
jgi:hypothetical protein